MHNVPGCMRSLHAFWFAGSWRPASHPPRHTPTVQARARRESFLNSVHPAGSTTNGLAHNACIGISIS